MTPDGQHLVGPVPEAEGFFVTSVCNVAGLSVSPAIGEALAEWIVDRAAEGGPRGDVDHPLRRGLDRRTASP